MTTCVRRYVAVICYIELIRHITSTLHARHLLILPQYYQFGAIVICQEYIDINMPKLRGLAIASDRQKNEIRDLYQELIGQIFTGRCEAHENSRRFKLDVCEEQLIVQLVNIANGVIDIQRRYRKVKIYKGFDVNNGLATVYPWRANGNDSLGEGETGVYRITNIQVYSFPRGSYMRYTLGVGIDVVVQPPPPPPVCRLADVPEHAVKAEICSIYQRLLGDSFQGRYRGVADIITTVRWKIQVHDDRVKAILEYMEGCIEETKHKYDKLEIWTGFLVNGRSATLFPKRGDIPLNDQNAVENSLGIVTFAITNFDVFRYRISDEGYHYGVNFSLRLI